MAERTVHYVQNRKNKKFLNLHGGWSESIRSYRLATFETSEAASAAFPEGEMCVVVTRTVKEG